MDNFQVKGINRLPAGQRQRQVARSCLSFCLKQAGQNNPWPHQAHSLSSFNRGSFISRDFSSGRWQPMSNFCCLSPNPGCFLPDFSAFSSKIIVLSFSCKRSPVNFKGSPMQRRPIFYLKRNHLLVPVSLSTKIEHLKELVGNHHCIPAHFLNE